MNNKPYDVWISMYNDELQTTYKQERLELRKLAMIYCAFQNELDSLKTRLNEDIQEMKAKLQRRDILKKCKNFAGLAQSEYYDIKADNKENEIPDTVPSTLGAINNEKSKDCIEELPCSMLHSLPSSHQEPSSVSIINKSPTNKRRDSGGLPLPLHAHKKDKSPNIPGRKSDEFRNSVNTEDSNIMECSIIEDTPSIVISRRNKPSNFLQQKSTRRKFNKSIQKSTLTQMFFSPKKKKKKEIDTNGPSMSISEIVDLVNQSSSDTDAELDKSDDTTVDDLDDNIIENSPKKDLKSFIQNYDKIPEKKKETPDFVYKEVVRGRARKQLKGWSCEECENYYKYLNLPPDELEKKKDECSKHRHKFKPNDETYKGFWDLTFGPTPKTEDSEVSMIFNIKKL